LNGQNDSALGAINGVFKVEFYVAGTGHCNIIIQFKPMNCTFSKLVL